MTNKFNSMAELKTKKNDLSVEDFINKIPEAERRKDALIILVSWKKQLQQRGKCGDHPLLVLGITI
ncbi:MAG: hypothetical protein NVS1B13_17540 [Flavisolibacter sp.]